MGRQLLERHLPICQARSRLAIQRRENHRRLCPQRPPDAEEHHRQSAATAADGAGTESHHPAIYAKDDGKQTFIATIIRKTEL